jgi:hypothetical protein
MTVINVGPGLLYVDEPIKTKLRVRNPLRCHRCYVDLTVRYPVLKMSRYRVYCFNCISNPRIKISRRPTGLDVILESIKS